MTRGGALKRPAARALPDDHACLRRQEHLVAFLDTERVVKSWLIFERAVGAELAGRMRIGLDLHDLRRIAHFAAPDLAKAHEEALVAAQTVDHRRSRTI